MTRLVKIKFERTGKRYDFDCGSMELEPGDKIIVETERGKSVGTVAEAPREVADDQLPEGLKQVTRKVRPEDLDIIATNTQKEARAYEFCQRRIAERHMEMKLVRVEYLFDSSKAIFYFTAEGRVDFRDLVKDLAHEFHTRIEMRQIGVRDEAKMVGGIGICGRELCCAGFLREFEPVSVKMAKEQNLALNPTKISGQCGRLLCCLGYEYETYCSLKKCLPKCGKQVSCKEATGEVVKLNILEGTVTVRTDDHREVVLQGDQIKPEQISDKPKKPKEPEPQRKQREDDGKRQNRDKSPQGQQKEQPRQERSKERDQGKRHGHHKHHVKKDKPGTDDRETKGPRGPEPKEKA